MEERLSETFPPDDKKNGKFRSALWDLERRYPDYVIKNKVGSMAVIVPSQKLMDDREQICIPNYAPTAREKYAETLREERRSPYFDIVEFKAKLSEIIEYIEVKGLSCLRIE